MMSFYEFGCVIAIFGGVLAILGLLAPTVRWLRRADLWHVQLRYQVDEIEVTLKAVVDCVAKEYPEIFQMILDNREQLKKLKDNPRSFLKEYYDSLTRTKRDETE